MSQLLITEYLNDLATLKRVSGAQRESVVREAFKEEGPPRRTYDRQFEIRHCGPSGLGQSAYCGGTECD